MKKIWILLIVISFSTLKSTTLIDLPFTKIAKRAKLIVKAKVIEIETTVEDFDDYGEVPVQYINLVLENVYKNNSKYDFEEGDEITIRQIGGKIDNKELRVDGLAKFTEDEEIFVSLDEYNNGYWYVIGASLGKYELAGKIAIRDDIESGIVRVNEMGEINFSKSTIVEVPLDNLIETVKKVNNME